MVQQHQKWIEFCVSEYESSLIGYAKTMTRDLEVARDIVQETFLKLLEQERNEVEHKLAAWLFTVTRNKALDHLKKEKRMASLPETVALEGREKAPEAATMQKEESNRLLRLIQKLPLQQQEVIRLKFKHGLKYKEIAKVLGLTSNHVGVLIHQALKSLRQAA